MKLNHILQLIIKLLVLIILIVMLLIIVMFLCSTKYWRDVHNYINANITITHIPKRSEMENWTIIEETTEFNDFTTDIYESTTTDINNGDYFDFADVENVKTKRSVKIGEVKDYSEVESQVVDYYFNINESETEDMNDLVDESKLTATDMKDVELVTGILLGKQNYLKNIDRCTATEGAPQLIFPWVATIFIKNDTNQFQYYCDGALLSENVVLTTARCLKYTGTWANSDDILVLLGKTSLLSMNEHEKVVKVKNHIIHENYNIDSSENDIAIMVLEESVTFVEGIQPACIGFEGYEESLTTGWALDGDLTPITLQTVGNEKCIGFSGNSTYCAVYGSDVGVCPSYGGMHVARHGNRWHLHGIRYGDPSERGPCFDNTVFYTDVNSYIDWIVKYIN